KAASHPLSWRGRGRGRARRRRPSARLLLVEAVGGQPGHQKGEPGVGVGPRGSADRAAAPLPGVFGRLLVAAAAELVPTLRAGGDPPAMQQVQGEGGNGRGCRGWWLGRVGSVRHQGLHGLWCARPGRVTTAPASLLARVRTAGRRWTPPCPAFPFWGRPGWG